MNKVDFDKLTRSIKEAGQIRRSEREAAGTTEIRAQDVRSIRQRLGKSQSQFALMIGVSVATLQNWEQGRRRPEGPAQALLKIAAKNPQAVEEALGG
ncbi:MAG: helix-turn-helix domain-containing protein [Spirochaetaceae bacterium]|nr:MAG: helix-turn-helix domain-containing protein [Spirochaetaceae bacterium]